MKSFSHMQLPGVLGLSLVVSLLSGCSYVAKAPGMSKLIGDDGIFRDRQGDYLKAETIPRTKIPAGLNGQVIDDLLVIPELAKEAKVQSFLEPPPPRELEARSDREVVIQRMDQRAWIVAEASPSQVWPRIRDYWRQNNVVIAFENPTGGIMETGWFVLAGNVTTQEKFRVIVDTGFQDNSSEIRLLHMEAPQAAPVLVQRPFPAQSMNPETEYTVLSSLSTHLADFADVNQASSVSFLAGSINSTGKAALSTTPGGNKVLQLKADFTRSWAALGRALRRANITIQGDDSTQGLYEVVYIPGLKEAEAKRKEKEGFFHNVWTLYGLLDFEDKLPAYVIRLQVLKAGNEVEVLASPPGPVKDADSQNAANGLLELLRNTIS